MRRVTMSGWALLAALLLPAAAHGACLGDCDGDGRVVINELVTGVNIALEQVAVDTCAPFDGNRNERVTVDELVTGVNHAADECPFFVVYDRTNARLTSPLPDDFWLVEAEVTATGVRLSVPLPDAPEDVQRVYGALLPDANLLDGFSPIAHFAIELTDAPDPASLPSTPAASLDPASNVTLWDLASDSPNNGRVPILVRSRTDTTPMGMTSHTLLIFPSIPLAPRGRYALAITRGVTATAERRLRPSSFFSAALAPAQPGEPAAIGHARALIDNVLDVVTVRQPELTRDDLALVLRASVRSTDAIPRDLVAIKEGVLIDDPPVATVDTVEMESDPNSDVAAIVRGTWQAPDWRAELGTPPRRLYLARTAENRPQVAATKNVPFILVLPKAALTGPVPITMYQHGNPGSAEREVPSSARRYLAAAGFAVIGFTDTLNRELSPGISDPQAAIIAQVAGVLFPLLDNHKVPDYWVETSAEQLAFVRMIQALGALDVLPVGAPDGTPDLDVAAPLTYVGISEGANNGPALLPYAPEIRAAALIVGGARLSEVLIHQQAASFISGLGAIFPSATPADIWAGFVLFQTIYDVQDRHNHVEFIYRHPVPINGDARRASILVVEGLDDTLVPNHATESLAWSLGPVPHLQPVQRPVPFLEPVTGPVVANIDARTTAAFYQYVPVGVPGIDPTPGCFDRNETEGHYCAQSAAESLRQRTVFFQSALTDPAPTIIDPLSE